MSLTRTLSSAILATALALPSAASAALYDIILVRLALKGVVQDDSGPAPAIGRYSLSQADLQNLAMGRAKGSGIRDGEVLALALYCPAGQIEDSQLVVFDKQSAMVLELVADVNVNANDVVQNASTAVFTAQLDFKDTGNATNGIENGDWMLGAVASLNAQGCPVAVKAGAVGDIELDIDGTNLDLVMPKAKFGTTGGVIDTIDQ
jgi:hypothetical protein